MGDPDVRYFSLYQPVVDLASRATVGYEATLHGERGGHALGPGELFSGTATIDATLELDRVGWETALAGCGSWLGAALLFVKLGTGRVSFAALGQVLGGAALPPAQIVVELAPGRSAAGRIAVRQCTEACRGLGVGVALVDVAEPAQIAALDAKVDVVKLGRALAEDDATPAATVAAALRHGARPLAFGIETDQQARKLQTLGVQWGQGYLLGRPRLPG